MAIISLSDHIILDILRRLSANSFKDLFNVKKVCKLIFRNSERISVDKAVELSKFRGRLNVYHGAEKWFMKMCLSNKNLEAFYNMGVQSYFQHNKTSEELHLLKSAAGGGYDRAAFVFAKWQRNQEDAEKAQNYISRLARINTR